MKKLHSNSLETVEVEIALFARRLTAITPNRKKKDLDRASYLLLRQVAISDSAGVKTLAHELMLDVSTASRQASALEKKGYLTKVADPNDGRAYFYELTEEGIIQLQHLKEARLATFTKLISNWSEEERQQFGNLLKKFNQSIRDNI